MKIIYLTVVLVLATCFTAKAQKGYKNVLRETNMAFYKTEQAKQVGNQILAYQRVTGGWPKNIDMVKPMSHEEMEKVLGEKNRQDDSTTDNDATNMQMLYLAAQDAVYSLVKSLSGFLSEVLVCKSFVKWCFLLVNVA